MNKLSNHLLWWSAREDCIFMDMMNGLVKVSSLIIFAFDPVVYLP